MKKTIAILTLAFALYGQQPTPVPAPPANQYGFYDSFSATSSETLTIQLPAGANRGWVGNWLKVSLNSPSTTATVCFGNNWAAASGTAGTWNQLFGASGPVSKVFTSNTTTGTNYYCEYITGSQAWNLQNMFMSRLTSTLQNLNITISGTSLTGYASILGVEQ